MLDLLEMILVDFLVDLKDILLIKILGCGGRREK